MSPSLVRRRQLVSGSKVGMKTTYKRVVTKTAA